MSAESHGAVGVLPHRGIVHALGRIDRALGMFEVLAQQSPLAPALLEEALTHGDVLTAALRNAAVLLAQRATQGGNAPAEPEQMLQNDTELDPDPWRIDGLSLSAKRTFFRMVGVFAYPLSCPA